MVSERRFGAFILTHGRPDNVITYDVLRKHGYTGEIVVLIDDEDEAGPDYHARFDGLPQTRVVEFSKDEIERTFDPADLSRDRRTIVYARNACFPVARELGFTHFVELDDDYIWFIHRYVDGPRIRSAQIRDLDKVWALLVDLLEDTGALTVAMSQGGDHMGGRDGVLAKQEIKRKAMNSFVCRTDRPVPFVGRINEDVNTYVLDGSRGSLFLTVLGLQLDQTPTQQSAGGMTDTYLDAGTFVKSFYTVMMHPSSVKVGTMGRTARRFHHVVQWDNTVPRILSDRWRKARP